MRSAILLLCIFTATSADISLISLGTKNAADDGYIYNRPSISFDLPQKEVIIKPNPGSSGPVISVTPRTKYNYPTPSSPFKPNEVPNASKQTRITNTEQVIITPRPVQTAKTPNFSKTTYNYPTPSIPFENSSNGYKYAAPKSAFKDGSNNIDIITPPTTPRKPSSSKGYDYPTPQPQLKYPNPVQEQISKASQQIKIPVSTRPTTTTAKPTPKIIKSTYLPPEVTTPASTSTTTTRRPTTARLIDVTKEGYTYEKPAIPFESVDNKLRIDPPTPRATTTPQPVPSVYLPPSSTPKTTTIQKPIQSSYLPPEISKPIITTTTTTRRPTTARLIDVTKDGYTYEKPAIPFESVNNKLRVDPPTPRTSTTQKPIQSTYLPPEITRLATTTTTTRRPTTTTQKPIQSSYLPPEVTTTTTRRPTTARIIDVTKDGYTYEKPAIPFESVNNKLSVDPPTPRPITTSRTQKPIQSTYLPPEITRPATTSTTTRRPTTTTQKPIQSSYLPPEVPTITTRRPTTARIIDVTKDGYTYEKPAIPFDSVNNKLRVDPPTPRPITTSRTQKPIQSTYLPPEVSTTTTTRRPTTTTQKPIQSSYLPPKVPTTTRRPTTARIIDVTKDGYTYEKPAIPFESVNNKLRVDPPTPRPITRSRTQKPIQSTYLPPVVTRQQPTTTTIRPEKPSIQSRGGYKFEKPIVPAEDISTILRRPTSTSATNTVRGEYKYEKPNRLLSTYLPPTVKVYTTTRPTTTRPTTTRPTATRPTTTRPTATRPTATRPTTAPAIRSVPSTYLPPNDKPQQSKINLNTEKPTIITTTRPVITSAPKLIASTYLPPNEKPEQSTADLKIQIPTTKLTTVRTTSKSIPSTYLPPSERTSVRQQQTTRATTTRATVIPPKSVGSVYLPPNDKVEQSKTNLKFERPTTRANIQTTSKSVPSTYLPPAVRPTPKFIASTYIPPNEKSEQSKTNLRTQNPTSRLTTVRTTPKSIPSTYLPPSETVTKQQTTRGTTTHATVKPSPKSVPSTYLPPNEKAEQSKTNVKLQPSTTRATTTTPRSVPSTYLPPKEKPTIKVQPTTPATVKPTQKALEATYLPPIEKSEQSRSNLNFQKPKQNPSTTTTTIRTTMKSVQSTYLPPVATNGYHYPKPAIPFTF